MCILAVCRLLEYALGAVRAIWGWNRKQGSAHRGLSTKCVCTVMMPEELTTLCNRNSLKDIFTHFSPYPQTRYAKEGNGLSKSP